MPKTKALISCAVTAQLICVFVFAYANCWFSYVKALNESMELHFNEISADVVTFICVSRKFVIPCRSVSPLPLCMTEPRK